MLFRSVSQSRYGFPTSILEEVYRRGIITWDEQEHSPKTPEQYAFERVNSFIAGGYAYRLDSDLIEDAETHSNDSEKPCSRFVGSDELVDIYTKETPGQLIKRVVREKRTK